MSLKELKARANGLDPQVRVGKNGLTDGIVKEITDQLRAKKLVKIKFLKAFLENIDKKSAFAELASTTGSVIVDQTGNVVVLWKR